MLPYFLLFATAVVFTTGPKMAALQRFIEDSRGSVGSRFVDVAIYDHILGDDFCLAKEVASAERAGTLGGLGFYTRRFKRPVAAGGKKPHAKHLIYIVTHLIYSGPTEPVPANEVATLLPSSRSAPREKSAARTTPVSSIAGLSRNNMSLLL
jgi:hypothetical protein